MNKDIILLNVSENLRIIRLKKRYTQEHLAEKAGITQKYLNMIEKRRVNPSIVVVVNLCIALDVDLNSIVDIK